MSSLSNRRNLLLSDGRRGPRKRRGLRRCVNGFLMFQTGKQRLPSGFQRALEMERLHAQERKHAAAREETRGARTGGEALVLFENCTQPNFFMAINFVEGDEIAVNDFVGFATQDVGEAAGHAGAKI